MAVVAQHEREHGPNCEQGFRRKERAEKRTSVYEIAQPTGQPDISDFLLNLREAAELQHGCSASFAPWQAGTFQIGDSTVEMIAQLAIQAALQLFCDGTSSPVS